MVRKMGMHMQPTTTHWTMLALGLATVALPRCNCDTEPAIGRAAVELKLTLVEVDPCSGAPVSRRIPDDYTSLAPATDFGSRAVRTFELRSVGTAPLTVESIELSELDDEFVLEVLDTAEMPAMLPIQIPANRDPGAKPALVVRVTYAAADSMSDLVQLLVKTDDPQRQEVSFDLSAGRGRLEVCGTNGCVDDPVIDFMNVSRLSSKTEELVLKNVGEGDLDLRSIKLESASAEFCTPEATEIPAGVRDCTLVNLCKVLKAGESYTVNVTYSPVDGGEDTGVIRVTSGDAARGTVDVPINGLGAGPAICACAWDGTSCNFTDVIDFGFTDVGQTKPQAIRLVSCGTEPAELTVADLETDVGNPYMTGPEFMITGAFSTGLLNPGEFSEGEVTYAPTVGGQHTGGLRFATAQSTLRNWIRLLGRAATCDLEALPPVVAFGAIAGGASSDRTVVLVNNGAKACTVSQITDPGAPFSIENAPALPLMVAAGDSHDLTVRYTSPARAQPAVDTGSFEVVSDEPSPNERNTVQLNATGGGAQVCDLDVQPTGNTVVPSRDGSLRFGTVNIGYSKTLSVRVTNIGNAPCTLSSYNLTVSDASQFMAAPSMPLPATINPMSSATVDVTFAPTMGTALPLGYTALRNYVDIQVAGPALMQTAYSIGISGTPTVPTIDVLPPEVDFGLVTWTNPIAAEFNRSSCGSETRLVRIYNSGNGALEITSIYIDPTSDKLFNIVSVNNGASAVTAPYQMTIAPGGVAEVQLRYYPTRINPPGHHGLLVIENNVTMESTVPLLGEGTANANQTDTFDQLNDNKVDILWVVDDSGSMSEEQNDLAQNFQYFTMFASSLSADWQLGVITTEVNDGVSGKLWACNGFDKIITSGAANGLQAFQCAANVTNPPGGNRRPNPSGSDEQEAGLQAARIALDSPVRDAENAGFLRPDARLAVIVVSDEDDQSQGSVNLYVDFFRNIKGFRNPQLFSLSAIAGDVPNGCATAAAGPRYHDAAQQLGGQFESVCSSNWQNLLMNIGLDVFTLRHSWSLSRPADQATVQIRVNGMVINPGASDGWTYDPASNSISFHGAAIPVAGSQVEVQYGARCIP